ncbi:MAG: CHRD domain-containing protein [Streptosporangiales bacterium]|nr:CHRD domain-containing protein [Streptosporangiales bacterium]
MEATMTRMLALAVLPLFATATMPAAGVPGHGDRPTSGFARLTGEAEVPGPGDPDGRGVFVFKIRGDRLCYILTAKKIATPTAAHIHQAPRDQAGPVVVGLEPPVRGVSFDCIEAVPDKEQTDENAAMVLTESELAEIVADRGMFYVNVHNADFPDGAIRGQLR